MRKLFLCAALFVLVLALTSVPSAYAAGVDIQTPDITSGSDADTFPFSLINDLFNGAESPEGVTTTVEIMLLLTVLTLVPSILVLMTAFTRIVVILSFTRNAMGTQQTPPNQVIIGLALFLTYFVMAPVFDNIYQNAWVPYESGVEGFTFDDAVHNTVEPLRNFMFEQIVIQNNKDDLAQFLVMSGRQTPPENLADIPTHVLIPAYITSELKTAFRIGFYIFIPFIVIDMVVASALMSMGMMMLPPVMISLPFKIMLFVLIDGWNLLIQTMVSTFYPR